MRDNCFVDTNILVYCYSEDEPAKQETALNIAKNSTAFISTQVLTELANTLNKKFKLDWKTVEKVLFELRSEMNIFLNKPAII